MQRVIVLVARERYEARDVDVLSKAQRSALSGLSGSIAEMIAYLKSYIRRFRNVNAYVLISRRSQDVLKMLVEPNPCFN